MGVTVPQVEQVSSAGTRVPGLGVFSTVGLPPTGSRMPVITTALSVNVNTGQVSLAFRPRRRSRRA